METYWLSLIVGKRIWAGRYQHSIDSSASRVELNFDNINTTIFLDSETPIKASVVNKAISESESESCWSDEKYMVFREHEDNELIIRTFHKLWTAAVGTEKYNKDDWKRLGAVLYDAGYHT